MKKNIGNSSCYESRQLAAEIHNSLSWTPDGKYMASAVGNGDVRVHMFTGSSITLTCQLVVDNDAMDVKFSPDGKSLAVCTELGFLEFYRFDKTSLVPVMQGNISSTISLKTATWSTDGEYLAIGVVNPTFASYPTYSGPHLFLYNINKLAAIYNSYSGGIDLEKYLDVTVLGAANIQVDGIINSSPKTQKFLVPVGSALDLDYQDPHSVAWSKVNQRTPAVGGGLMGIAVSKTA